MSKYSTIKSVPVPQSEQDDPKQVQNNAGGFSFVLDKWKGLERFIILGSEGNAFYMTERKAMKFNSSVAEACIKEDAKRVVDMIVALTVTKPVRAIKPDPGIYILGLCLSEKYNACKVLRHFAASKVTQVCRTPTHLIQLIDVMRATRGMGRTFCNVIKSWYLNNTKLEYHIAKYGQRTGWSHRDILRLGHVKPTDEKMNTIFKYAVKPEKIGETTDARISALTANGLEILAALETIHEKKDVKQTLELIEKHNLSHEMIPSEMLKDKKIMAALGKHMPITATIRMLNRFSVAGLLTPLSDFEKMVIERITNSDNLKNGRVHPFGIFVALKTYQSGRGFRGDLTWTVNPRIVDALETAFENAMAHVQPTGKNYYIGVDVSGSMNSVMNNTNVMCSEAAAVMALIINRTEQNCIIRAFDNGVKDLGVTKKTSLRDMIKKFHGYNGGGTDCALPMIDAMKSDIDNIDAFIVLTDNETWAGKVHPHVALKQYRKGSKRNAKLIVAGMTTNGFTIADPSDAGMLDIVGFDSSIMQVIAEFMKD